MKTLNHANILSAPKNNLKVRYNNKLIQTKFGFNPISA